MKSSSFSLLLVLMRFRGTVHCLLIKMFSVRSLGDSIQCFERGCIHSRGRGYKSQLTSFFSLHQPLLCIAILVKLQADRRLLLIPDAAMCCTFPRLTDPRVKGECCSPKLPNVPTPAREENSSYLLIIQQAL